jgi:hypothetical protein
MREKYYKSLSIPVWIRAPGLPPLRGIMEAVSEHRAKLNVEDVYIIPERFDLLFSPIAQSWRECLVEWRRASVNTIGIKFAARRGVWSAATFVEARPHSIITRGDS